MTKFEVISALKNAEYRRMKEPATNCRVLSVDGICDECDICLVKDVGICCGVGRCNIEGVENGTVKISWDGLWWLCDVCDGRAFPMWLLDGETDEA